MLRHWNLHKIRPSRNSESPPGRPDVLFFLPQLQGTRDYKTIVPSDEIEIAIKDVCGTLDSHTADTGCRKEFVDLANIIIDDEHLSHPSNTDEALILYRKLVTSLENLLN